MIKDALQKKSEARQCIGQIAQAELDTHIALTVTQQHGRWWVVCEVCKGRWLVQFQQVNTGDEYCVNGATNYYGLDGKLLVRR